IPVKQPAFEVLHAARRRQSKLHRPHKKLSAYSRAISQDFGCRRKYVTLFSCKSDSRSRCRACPMLLRKLIYLLFLFPLTGLSTQKRTDAGFFLETRSLQPYTPAYIGNGYFSLLSTPLGITDAESFMAWVYDHGPDDVPRIAVLPAWNGVDIYNGKTWLSQVKPGADTIRSYHQQINMYEGSIETTYQWVDGEKVTAIEVQSFVSRSNLNLA